MGKVAKEGASHFGFDVPLFARLVKLFIEVGAVVCVATNNYMRLTESYHALALTASPLSENIE